MHRVQDQDQSTDPGLVFEQKQNRGSNMYGLCRICGTPHGYCITTTVLEYINGLPVCDSCWQAFIKAWREAGIKRDSEGRKQFEVEYMQRIIQSGGWQPGVFASLAMARPHILGMATSLLAKTPGQSIDWTKKAIYYHHLHFSSPALALRFLEHVHLDRAVIISCQIIDVNGLEQRTVLLTSDHRLTEEEEQNVFKEANRLKPPSALDLIGWSLNTTDSACHKHFSREWLAGLIAEQGDTKFYKEERVSFLDADKRLYGTICLVRPKEHRTYLIAVEPNEKWLITGMFWKKEEELMWVDPAEMPKKLPPDYWLFRPI